MKNAVERLNAFPVERAVIAKAESFKRNYIPKFLSTLRGKVAVTSTKLPFHCRMTKNRQLETEKVN